MRPGHRPGAGRAFLMPAGLSCLNRASGRSRDSDHRRLFADVHFSTRRFSGAGDRLSAPHRRTAIIRAPGLRRISQVSPHRLCHRADRLGRPSAANGDRWGMARAFRRGLGSFSLVLKVWRPWVGRLGRAGGRASGAVQAPALPAAARPGTRATMRW